MIRAFSTTFAVIGLIVAPLPALAQDSEQSDDEPESVRVECPEYLAYQPKIVQEKCREAARLHGQDWFPGVTVLIPVAAMAAAGIVLTNLKEDPPVSR